MKKITKISAFFYVSLHGLDYTIENKTNGQIQIMLEYEANKICTATERIIQKNQKATIKSGLCRAYQITIYGTDQSLIIQKKIKKSEYNQCTISVIHKVLNLKRSDNKLNIQLIIEYQK